MILWVLLVFIILIAYYCISNHIHVDLKSLFKKGFQKTDNLFRFILLYRQTTELVRHIVVLIFLLKIRYYITIL